VEGGGIQGTRPDVEWIGALQQKSRSFRCGSIGVGLG